MGHRQAAQTRGRDTQIVGRQRLRRGFDTQPLIGREVGAEKRRQQLDVIACRVRQIGHFRTRAEDGAAELCEAIGQPVECGAHTRRGRAQRMLLDRQDAEIGESVVARRR